MINKYKHVIWDWNGTLLDDVELCLDLINNLLSEKNLSTLSLEQYRDIFEIPVKNYYEKAGFDFNEESFEVVGKKWMDKYELRKFECSLSEGALTVLNFLFDLGVQQSILSAYPQHTLEELVKHYGLTKYFTYIFGLDNIYAASKLHLGKELIKLIEQDKNKSEVVLIGDTLHDYEVARDMGIDCIIITNGHQAESRFKSINEGNLSVVKGITELIK